MKYTDYYELFLNSFAFADICKNHDIICIYLTGSRSLNTALLDSDVDFTILTVDGSEHAPKFQYSGCHWFVHGLDFFKEPISIEHDYRKCIGLVAEAMISYDSILYINDKCLDIFNKWFDGDRVAAGKAAAKYLLLNCEEVFSGHEKQIIKVMYRILQCIMLLTDNLDAKLLLDLRKSSTTHAYDIFLNYDFGEFEWIKKLKLFSDASI